MIDRTILGLSRAKLEFRTLADRLEGDPERAALRRLLRRHARTRSATSSTELEAAWKRHGHGYHFLRAETDRRAGGADQGPQGRARPADGGQRGPHAAGGVRRGHRGRARAARRRTSRASRRSSARHGLKAGFYGHCSVGCLHIRPFLDLSRPDQVELMKRGRGGGRRPRRRVRRRELLRARRRARSARRSTRGSSATTSTARCARSSSSSTRTTGSTRA